ncbi:MAG TPA: hypothetical protein VG939_21705 [Caulobacteraceae bacterium]|nr:hypothetical protein [Caulobacteraceae bacterium]
MTDIGLGETPFNRDETLAALPSLLSLARQVIVTAFDPGDPEVDALRALIEECVVGVHRVCLREQLRAADDGGRSGT